MQTHNIHVAKTIFLQLVDAAANGETIIIAKAGAPVVKLVPIATPKRRGILSDMTFNADAFQAMDSEMSALFERTESSDCLIS
ncbi:type II toxin-antitoxin system Phd/YefM family antitoxin [Pseudomonas putida]|uniref:type II toxin-antitoxin system Phd/YefM family antitoxin n=1 Tax=Pseudomonas putida TaxID=303 RepID=UPI00370BD3B2